MRTDRTPFRLALLIAASLAAGCGATSTEPGTTTTTTPPPAGGPVATTAVTIKSLAFTPPAIVVARGATVSFSNQDGFEHNATFSDAGIVASGNIAGGSAASVTMPAVAGTYAYHCTLHAGMTGSVTVQ